jgi:hypothetical protein
MGPASAALVSECPAGEQQTLRFMGDAGPVSGATVFLACQ